MDPPRQGGPTRWILLGKEDLQDGSSSARRTYKEDLHREYAICAPIAKKCYLLATSSLGGTASDRT
jgi:hypothetical protein